MRLALKNIEKVKIYYRNGEIQRILIFMKDKTVRGGYYLDSISKVGKTVEKYMYRAERTIKPCGGGYSTATYILNSN